MEIVKHEIQLSFSAYRRLEKYYWLERMLAWGLSIGCILAIQMQQAENLFLCVDCFAEAARLNTMMNFLIASE